MRYYAPRAIVKNGKKFWRKHKRTYGEDYRIVCCGIPLVSFWNTVPIYLRWQWHCNTCFNNVHKGKRKVLKNETGRSYSPSSNWHADLRPNVLPRSP